MKFCDVCGRSEEEVRVHKTKKFGETKFLCGKHYNHMLFYGEIKERGLRDKNEIIEKDDYLIIKVYNQKSEKVAESLISKEHKYLAEKYKWGYNDGYLKNNTNGLILLHRLIVESIYGNIPENMTVDHINRNRLDNRKENLRLADNTLQAINQNIRIDNKSGVKGVFYGNTTNQWFAVLSYKKHRLREICPDFESAVIKRKEWEHLRDIGKLDELIEREVIVTT